MLRNFCFVVDRVLAGSALPGSWDSLDADLEDARSQNIGAIVSLTESPLPAAKIREAGMRHLHLPVEDFTPPTTKQAMEFVRFVDAIKGELDKATLVHCRAGIGRTGTMLACYLVAKGAGADEAIERIRNLRPGSLETGDQERMVRDFEREVRRR